MTKGTFLGVGLACSLSILPMGSTVQAEQFAMDVPFEVLAREQNKLFLSDLRVGDTALTSVSLCGDREGRVFMRGFTEIQTEASQWSDSLEVRILPGRELDVTWELSERSKEDHTRDERALAYLTYIRDCEHSRASQPVTFEEDRFELFQVRTINGHHRLSDLVGR